MRHIENNQSLFSSFVQSMSRFEAIEIECEKSSKVINSCENNRIILGRAVFVGVTSIGYYLYFRTHWCDSMAVNVEWMSVFGRVDELIRFDSNRWFLSKNIDWRVFVRLIKWRSKSGQVSDIQCQIFAFRLFIGERMSVWMDENWFFHWKIYGWRWATSTPILLLNHRTHANHNPSRKTPWNDATQAICIIFKQKNTRRSFQRERYKRSICLMDSMNVIGVYLLNLPIIAHRFRIDEQSWLVLSRFTLIRCWSTRYALVDACAGNGDDDWMEYASDFQLLAEHGNITFVGSYPANSFITNFSIFDKVHEAISFDESIELLVTSGWCI